MRFPILTKLIGVLLSLGVLSSQTKLIKIDGSSTVYPIIEAVAEEFQKVYKDVKVTVGISGTGGGFKKFSLGEIDITNASRPIKKSEHEACLEKKIQYIEIPIAYDALTVVVNKKNKWVDCLTVEELKQIWQPEAEGKVTNWSQVRKGFPKRKLVLYGPGVDSGTFDYFTSAVVGKERSSRGDYIASEDDNVLVQGVATDVNALGYFGFAYYVENKDRLKAVKIDGGAGCVEPSFENVLNGKYVPLSRPLFIYINAESATKKEVGDFVKFLIDNAPRLVKEVGYIPLPEKAYKLAREKFEKGIKGSVFEKMGWGPQVGLSIEELLKIEYTH